MITKTTSREEFAVKNREKATELARQEIEAEKARKEKIRLEKQAELAVVDRVLEAQQRQYNKLMALERKEMQNQKEISDIWVKYIYLLLGKRDFACWTATPVREMIACV